MSGMNTHIQGLFRFSDHYPRNGSLLIRQPSTVGTLIDLTENFFEDLLTAKVRL